MKVREFFDDDDGAVGVYRGCPMMMTFITQGGEGRGEKIRRGKLRKAKAEALKMMMTWCVVLLKRHSSIVRVVVRCFIDSLIDGGALFY